MPVSAPAFPIIPAAPDGRLPAQRRRLAVILATFPGDAGGVSPWQKHVLRDRPKHPGAVPSPDLGPARTDEFRHLFKDLHKPVHRTRSVRQAVGDCRWPFRSVAVPAPVNRQDSRRFPPARRRIGVPVVTAISAPWTWDCRPASMTGGPARRAEPSAGPSPLRMSVWVKPAALRHPFRPVGL